MSEKNINISITTGSITRFAIIILAFIGFFLLKDVVVILLTSIVIASFIEVVSNKLKRKYKIPRTLVVVSVFFGMIFVITSLVYFLVPIFIDQFSTLAIQLSKALPQVEFLKPFTSRGFATGAQNFAQGIADNTPLTDVVSGARGFIGAFSTSLFASLSTFFGGVVTFFLTMVISFYLSMQERGVENFLKIIVPLKHENYAIDLWERTEKKIALWVRGQLFLGLLVGALVFIGLQIMGIQYSLILALVAAVFELVPFGMIFAAIPAVILASIQGGMGTGLMVMLLYIIIQQFENYVIAPFVVKKVVGISPLIVIIALLIGSKLAGFWGFILAVPAAVFLTEILNDNEKKKNFAKVLE